MAITHSKVSGLPDGPDTDDVLPSEWNAAHAIANGTITLAQLADMATARLLGRTTSGTGVTEALTATQAKALLAIAAGDVSGLAASATTDALNASNISSGTLAAGRLPAHTGDVTSSAGSAALTLAAGSASNLNSGTLAAARLPALTGAVTTSAGSAATSQIFSVSGTMLDPTGARNIMAWQAPFACTVTKVRGHAKGGTNAVVNARLNQTSNFLATSITVSTMNAWADGGAVQNTALAVDDDIEFMLVSISGAITEVSWEVVLTRP